MVGESYQRAYNSMVAVQMLAELEEVIQYKLVPERRLPITHIWWERLQVGQEEEKLCVENLCKKLKGNQRTCKF